MRANPREIDMDKTQQIESLVMKMMSDFEEIARFQALESEAIASRIFFSAAASGCQSPAAANTPPGSR